MRLLPPDAIERTCRALASGPEPKRYEARRLVLEGLLELRASVNGGDLTISGKLPVPAAEVKKNWEDRLASLHNSFEPIPFVIKARVAA